MIKNQNEKTIVKNQLQGSAYLRSISVGISEENTIVLLGQTMMRDYWIVQVHKKLFAIPAYQMKELEFKS